MKPIIITGFHNSGKTTTILKALRGLTKKGWKVHVIKHTEKINIFDQYKDTESFYLNGAEQSTVITPEAILSFSNKNKGKTDREILQDIILTSPAEYIIIEGFKKSDLPVPRIVVCKDDNPSTDLFNDLTIGYISKTRLRHVEGRYPKSRYLNKEIPDEDLANFIEENTFEFLGGLDCGECGYTDCRALASAIIEGKDTAKRCKPLTSDVELYIDNKRIPMKDFVRSILKGTVEGFIKNLHGWKKGEIRLRLK